MAQASHPTYTEQAVEDTLLVDDIYLPVLFFGASLLYLPCTENFPDYYMYTDGIMQGK